MSEVATHCRQCSEAFTISDRDQAFYEKMKVPVPTLCPDCRLQRRLAHRNERNLYKRTCDKTGKEIISVYHPTAPVPVYDLRAWWGDGWSGLEYGREFDFSRTFFDQFAELQKDVPRMAVLQSQNENSLYTNCVSNLKSCYLLFSSDFSWDCYYGTWTMRSQNCCDTYLINECERTYASIFSDKLHHCTHMVYSTDCSDCRFCFDCHGCRHCLFCTNLRQQQYCIENRKYTKEEYQRKLQEWQLQTHTGQQRALHHHQMLVREKAVHLSLWRKGRVVGSTGDVLTDVENCHHCFDVISGKDCSYTMGAYEVRDVMDCTYVYKESGYENCECFPMPLRSAFNLNTYHGSNLFYCDLCFNDTRQCFGCIGLKRQQYCILNKQYSKQEYESLLPKIIEHMRRTKEYGEFFPASLSPYAYNESEAQDLFPLSREDVHRCGLQWRDREDDVGAVERVLPADGLPDSIDAIPDDILHWAVTCAESGRLYRIVVQELAFYRTMRLPVPRLHPEQRHRRRISLRNPRKLWDRQCDKCGAAIMTSYAPERPETVYCESCYLEAVY